MLSCIFRNRAAAAVLALFAMLLTVFPVLVGGLFTEADVKKMAIAVTKAAHPTGKNAALLKYSEPKKDGFLLIKMEVEYYGALSKNRYTADALMEFQLPKKASDPLEVTRIDFVDKNSVLDWTPKP